MKKEQFMHEAIQEALLAKAQGEVPIGAVVVYDNRIIGRGHNTRQTTQQATHHAEIKAIEQACATLGSWRLEDCDLYVTVEPCPMCAGAIIMSRMRSVIYGTVEQKMGAHQSVIDLFEAPFNHKVGVESGVCAAECKTLLQDFFRELRQKT